MKTHTTLFDKLMTAVTFAEAGMVDTAMTFDRTPGKKDKQGSDQKRHELARERCPSLLDQRELRPGNG